jgi:hypothetical protein
MKPDTVLQMGTLWFRYKPELDYLLPMSTNLAFKRGVELVTRHKDLTVEMVSELDSQASAWL